jgi:DNA-binding PadR family transcriptional regulator
MSTKLVILGLLKDKPLYGYELKHIIEEHMGDWTNIAFGSIYFALKKMTEEAYVRELGQEKREGRPSRRIYEITEKGMGEFQALLLQLWTDDNREYFPLDIGLFFLNELPEEKRLSLIEARLKRIHGVLSHLENHSREVVSNPSVPPVAGAIFSHTLYHLKAEKEWLEELKVSVESGKFS